ncbi:MAG TPA: ATP synthase F1 subunit gamma [Thermomicrobiales bacterium]|nr:ATP synthase F1 subunit gamma [Thermomicrobiales bacterium]
MATTREIRRRIRSIGNITQITRAMEMVSAAKMRRAQERVTASRAYSDRIRVMISGLAGLTDLEEGEFPLLEQRPIERVSLIVMTSDKGLAGALNSNVIRTAAEFIREEVDGRAEIIALGKKGRDFFRKTRYPLTAEFIQMQDWPTIEDLRPVVDIAIEDFTRGKVDAVYIVNTRFYNTLTQRPQVQQLLPITPEFDEEAEEAIRDFIFEPSREEVLNALLPRYVEVQIYQAMLDSLASEHSARMVAMRNATENANELMDDLTLSYNKARQAQITAEVSEIAAGALASGS